MTSAIPFVLVLALLMGVIALLRWRFRYPGFPRRDLGRAGLIQGQVTRGGRSYRLPVGGQDSLPLTGGQWSNRDSSGAAPMSKEQRAESFLQRILALTGAKKLDGAYVLNVGKVQFQLRDRFIRRLQNPNDPESPYEETCFYLVHNGMPKVEEIATALLHLSNNPALFDKWAIQNGVAFKADGRVFDRCPLIGLR